jgi:hypothetical protein
MIDLTQKLRFLKLQQESEWASIEQVCPWYHHYCIDNNGCDVTIPTVVHAIRITYTLLLGYPLIAVFAGHCQRVIDGGIYDR